MPGEGGLSLEPVRVRVDAARAADFARETGFTEVSGVAPFTYPAVWLSEPQFHGAIMEICAGADSVPVHESQKFDYETPLKVDVDYELRVTMRREDRPPRLHVEALLTMTDGTPVGRFETLLRLVSRAGFSGGAAS